MREKSSSGLTTGNVGQFRTDGLRGVHPEASRRGQSQAATPWYTELMLDDSTFRHHADAALESLKKSLFAAEEGGEFEVEENSGALNVLFEEPPGKFVITPNAPVRQIWISALSTSFKLDWSEELSDFVLPKDKTLFRPLVASLINRHLGTDSIVLS
jgi:frataxin